MEVKGMNLDNFIDFLCDKFNADRDEMEEEFRKLVGEIKEILNSPNGGIYAPTSSTEWRPLEIPQCSFCDSNNPIVWEDVDGKKMCSHCANGKKYF